MDKLSYFKNELDQLKDPELKNVAEEIINSTPEFYFTIPASTTGNFHPKNEQVEGGKVLHHRKCFKLASQAGRRYELNTKDMEILKTACLLHDIPYCFYYDEKESRYRTDPEHAQKSAEAIALVADRILTPENESLTLKKLVASVYFHMGIWAKYNPESNLYKELLEFKNHPLVLATQECDFYCSRRFIDIELEEEKVNG